MDFTGTCVGPDGSFIVGVHKPHFGIKNFRDHSYPESLGALNDGSPVDNHVNFPDEDLHEPGADFIYEIANAFPFRGTSFINSAWADAKAAHPENIGIKARPECSFFKKIEAGHPPGKKTVDKSGFLDLLPRPLQLALAQASTDPEELVCLAKKSCRMIFEPGSDSETASENGNAPVPVGMGYRKNQAGGIVPDIQDHELFEVLVNNPALPDIYKNTMVLRPGVQGSNEITGEYLSETGGTHVFEYLRRNSYIPWGHFASNMANDAIRYRASDLSLEDMTGIRHLYYQRIYARMAAELGIQVSSGKRLSESQLEDLRKTIAKKISENGTPQPFFNHTLWGWNFGFGFAQSGHRLHASHQMIHQQNAMVPDQIPAMDGSGSIPAFSCGRMVHDWVIEYRNRTGKSFFQNYLSAIRSNIRTDQVKGRPDSLVVFEDDQTLLFIPKAQVSEWEIQLMVKKPLGNILETDTRTRASIDRGILYAVQTLEKMGADMVTSIEYARPMIADTKEQHLIYAFIPRLPYAPGTFSEAQLRWISGCYPEDVAQACRNTLETILKEDAGDAAG